MDEALGDGDASLSGEGHLTKTKSICSDDESLKTMTMLSTESNTETKTTPQATPEAAIVEPRFRDKTQTAYGDDDLIYTNEDGLMMLPESHPDYLSLIRLQLENQELIKWKHQLQRRVQNERAEVIRLKTILNNNPNALKKRVADDDVPENIPDDGSYERIITQYVRENTVLEQKRNNLVKHIFDENRELIQMQVELAIRKYQI